MRLRQGYLEIELDEEPDLATVPSAITVTPSGGSPLALSWSGLGDGFTVRSDQTLPAGTFDLQVGTELQDLAGTALLAAYVEQFVLVGANVDLEVYEAPDERVIPTSSVGNLHGFHGHPRDPETGLVYIRNRYYDPEFGRFITADPLGYVDGPSMYQFAGYSPVNFGDALGLCVFGWSCAEALSIVGETLAGAYQDAAWAAASTGAFVLDFGVDTYTGAKHRAFNAVEHVQRANAVFDANAGRRRPEYDIHAGSTVQPTTLHAGELAAIRETFSQMGAAAEDAAGAAYSSAELGSILTGAGGMITLVRNGFLKRVLRSEADDFLAKGWKPLVETGEEAVEAGAGRVVPRGTAELLPTAICVPLGNQKFGLKHILRRHSFNSGAEGVSRFSRGMGHIEIRGLIQEANATSAAWRVEGSSRVLDVGMGRVIGTDPLGSATSGLRVVTTASGDVVSAYPIPWP